MIFVKEYKPWKKVKTFFAIIPVNIYGNTYVWGEMVYHYSDWVRYYYFGRKKDYKDKKNFYLRAVCGYTEEDIKEGKADAK